MRHTQGPPTVCDSPSSAASGRNHEKISVTRSIVFQVVGPCKTEASQKPVPLDPCLAEALHTWRQHTSYRAADDWVFASRAAHGKRPYWGQSLMRTIIRPAAAKIEIGRASC